LARTRLPQRDPRATGIIMHHHSSRCRLAGMPELRSGETVATAPSKPKVLVRLDVDRNAAYLQIRGTVTGRNLGVLYPVARRACTITGGLAVVLDLRQAAVDAVPLAELQSACRTGELPSAAGPVSTPCRLEVLEPAAA
jgi:hypothetical protein